jgi:hypothetical protein
MKPTICFLSLVFLVACCGFAHAEPIELRFKPKVGQETKHRMMIAARVESSSQSEEEGSSAEHGEAQVRIDFARKVTAGEGEETTIETRQLKGEVSVTVEGKETTIALPPFRCVKHFDRRRHEVGLSEDDGGDPPESDEEGTGCEIVGSLGIGCGMWAEMADMLTLPAEPVEVGATWKHEHVSVAQGEKFVLNYKLEELTTRSGRKCAKIRATWRHQFSSKGLSDLAEMQPGTTNILAAEGVTTGDLVCYYDYENSVDVLVEGTLGNESTTVATGSTDKAVMNVKIALVE